MRKYLDLRMNGHDTRLQLDTASDITVISEKLWNNIRRPPITNTSQTLVSACGGRLKLIGELKCSVFFRNAKFTGICYVTKSDLNILGLDWFDRLHLADVPLNSLCNTAKNIKCQVIPDEAEAANPTVRESDRRQQQAQRFQINPPRKHAINHQSSQKGR
ncbi:unnamed protein product [Trichobilharzia regenti]|nr:unnamed protein product [Trichobilharzia regenti]